MEELTGTSARAILKRRVFVAVDKGTTTRAETPANINVSGQIGLIINGYAASRVPIRYRVVERPRHALLELTQVWPIVTLRRLSGEGSPPAWLGRPLMPYQGKFALLLGHGAIIRATMPENPATIKVSGQIGLIING